MIGGQQMQAKVLKGTKPQIQKLIRLSKEALKDGFYRVAIRLHAVALNMEGKHAPDIAHNLKVHRSKVSIWLQNYEQEGIEGLLEGHRSGKPSRLSEDEFQELSDIIESGPVAYGFTTGVWTSPMVARVIEYEFNVSYSFTHVQRILHKLGFSVQRPKKSFVQADPKLKMRWIRYKYPDIKKKPRMKEQQSSSKTKPASVRNRPSIRHGQK
jgi:transposase